MRPVGLVSAIVFLFLLDVVKTAMEFGANLFQLMKFSNRQVITYAMIHPNPQQNGFNFFGISDVINKES